MSDRLSSIAVVITGASTGIGAACALDCAGRGMTVFAGVRDPRAGKALAAKAGPSLIPITLDVTDEPSIMRSVEVVQRVVGEGGLGGLVNNAGIVIGSPLEVIPLSQLRKQLEVNVIGQIAVTQAFLPLLRRGRGRIVNMGSIAGRGTIPLLGPYSASKYALEALTDALRMELKPWGIQVSIIEPGAVATPIWEKSAKEAEGLEASASKEAKALYNEAVIRIREAVAEAAKRAIAPEAVVRAVHHALTASRPHTRYLVGSDAKLRAWMVKWLPDRVQDRLLSWALKYPREGSVGRGNRGGEA
jgi:NAD(P)-dependent dehydrogenase (short-subunit alcohol dehydrogenase family)